MLLRREGYPEEGEFVLCTVTNVHHNSVFATLDEYNKSGLIHISEISPGRIRNIRDYVVEGKKIVCLVLDINTEKGHIDLSLRRVNDNQKRVKINEIKQEQKAEKIVEHVAKRLNIGLTLFYKEVFNKVSKKYHSLSPFFEDVALEKTKIDEIGLDKEKAKVLEEAIKDRIKPTEVVVDSELKLRSYAPDGVELIKDAVDKATNSNSNINIRYEGGGRYKVSIKSSDYKEAEGILSKFKDTITELMEKFDGTVSPISKK